MKFPLCEWLQIHQSGISERRVLGFGNARRKYRTNGQRNLRKLRNLLVEQMRRAEYSTCMVEYELRSTTHRGRNKANYRALKVVNIR